MHVTIRQERYIQPDHLGTLQKIYDAGFPPEEVDPLSQLEPYFVRGDQQLLVAYVDEQPVGFAIGMRLDAVAGYYGRYVVVARDYRQQGIGTKLIQAMLDFAKSQGLQYMIFEVDHAEEAGISDHEKQIRQQRISYYDHLGATFMPCMTEFYAPAFISGHPPIMYVLMWITFEEIALNTDHIKEIVAELLSVGYDLKKSDNLILTNFQRISCDGT